MIDQDITMAMEEAIGHKIFPGGVVGYIKDGASHILAYGHLTYDKDSPAVNKDTIYDLASVTKVIPTNSIVLSLIGQGRLSEEDAAIKFIPELNMPGRETILIKHLLTFTTVFDLPGRLSALSTLGVEKVLDTICSSPLSYPSGRHYYYSNAVIVLLGIIVERVTGQPLDRVADSMFFDPLGMQCTSFHPEKLDTSNIAPTEINDRGLVQAKPHDETAWAFYKEHRVAGHAGLFSCAADLLTFGQMLLNEGQYKGRRYFNAQTMAKIKTELFNDGKFGMSLGWETNQSDFMSPAAAPKVYGKDGFTGTLILMDPRQSRCLVMLTNRTYPKRPANSEAINKVRRQLQDIVFD
jgi:CubicO group peptidase (beta-lactamase class C family)